MDPPYPPQLNGMFERKNRNLLDFVRSMLSYADLPNSVWVMLLKLPTMVWIVPSKILILHHMTYGYSRKPNLSCVKVLRCLHLLKIQYHISSIQNLIKVFFFVELSKSNTRYYYFYNLNEKKVVFSLHVSVLEK